MTVHQAKGRQWPAVFVPCLRDHRFPAQVKGGRTAWHVLPKSSVRNWARYSGGIEDERRLSYLHPLSGSTQWPREEHLEQVRIAVDMYFGNSPFLGTEGLADFNRQMFNLTTAPSVEHLYTVDFAELFVVFHEIQHHMTLPHLPGMPIHFQVQLPSDLEITPKRRSSWMTELNNDINSLCTIFMSAASVFMTKFSMSPADAKMQAACLVCAGADAALHTLQILEERRYGKVSLQAAATRGEYVGHPPSAFRRNILSVAAYSLVTGKSSDALFRRELPESWMMVAQNVQSHMALLDKLFAAYETHSRKRDLHASTGGLVTSPEKAWDLRALGSLSPLERATFYENLSDNDREDYLFISRTGNSTLYENPRLEIGIVSDNGSIVPAEKYPATEGIRDGNLDVFLERYFVQAMPGRQFDLQLAVSSRHWFDNRDEPDRVSHTLVVRGVIGDYANYLSEPVFQNLRVSDSLTLDIAVTFLTDRSTERLTEFLKRPELRQGIQLATTFNPVFGTVATYVRGVVESLAAAKKNQPITDAHVTFVARPGELSPPLIEATYVLFQPSTESDDSMTRKPRYDSVRRRIVLEDADCERNYMIMRIRRH